MQLRRSATQKGRSSFLEPDAYKKHARTNPVGPINTAKRIVEREGFGSLYKGLTAVYTGIVPKMALRFVSFEYYRDTLVPDIFGLILSPSANGCSDYKTVATFIAGLLAGVTEAILVVTPSETCKIRIQAQYHSMMDPNQMAKRKYSNVFNTAKIIAEEEGIRALWAGVVPTMLRQGCNQAVNFTAYQAFKSTLREVTGVEELVPWQHLLLGGLSGGFGPTINNPLDVVKTRMQRQVKRQGLTPQYTGIIQSCKRIANEEGITALWKGLTPRLMRIMPGQAITFMTYEYISKQFDRM
mmetsp:Transcript_15995/g.20940  ORF Transcript_15995/g.20940 Transcript_15995/m.20940 type:complete len:297 (+) Transcript_15995:2533-3423(+)